MSTFVDSSGLLAVLDRGDRHHEVAAAAWRKALQTHEPLITTNCVVTECVAVAQRRLGMNGLRRLVDGLLPVVTVAWVSPEEHQRALAMVLAADRRGLSLVDCTSFAAMSRIGVRRAFAFERHFAEHGFELIV
jgi:predicted nucleic acid-binding protein